MSRVFIIFLIALLPLRGWSLERMMFQMDMDAPSVTVASESDTAMSPDCAMHMGMNSNVHDADTDQGQQHKGCQACQLCMPLVTLDMPFALAITPLPHAMPTLHPRLFVSADAVRHAKPPIP